MQKRFIIIFGIFLLLLISFIHADVAPFGHRAASLNFLVKYDNQTIEEDFRADILVCSEEGCKSDMADGCVQGICTFPYYRIERVPSEMRLQVSLHDKTFTSGTFNFSEKWPLLKYYYDVNINPDGKMTITIGNGEIEQNGYSSTIPGILQAYYPLLRIFVCALALTILIELMVLIIFLRRWKVKGWKRPILSLVLADVISVPLVWIIFIGMVVVLSMIFQLLGILIAFVIAEAFAVVFEAFFIYWLNKKVISLKRLFILSIVMNVASLVIGGIALAVLSSVFIDSGSITENKPMENQFNASEYPVVIDKNKNPELSAFENDISREYETMLQEFYEEFYKGHEYECELNPALSKSSFNYLKPKQDIYGIRSDCGIPGDTMTATHDAIFYTTQEGIVMFYKKDVAPHFTEAFNNIESLDELKEYSEIYVDNLAINLDSALNNSLLSYSSSEHFEEDCPLLLDVPELTSTVSKEGNGFVYEGLRIQPELYASLYYLKYSITPDGQVVKDKEEMLAMCENMGIIY